MSSTNRTSRLGLNQWLGTDKPKREDFNMDNALIDSTLGAHIEDTDIHITSSERTMWTSRCYVGTYVGNTAAERTVALGCGFTPTFGLIFAADTFPALNDYTNHAEYNYFAMVTQVASTKGVTLSGSNIIVSQSSTPIANYEYRNFNEGGVTYIYVMFR